MRADRMLPAATSVLGSRSNQVPRWRDRLKQRQVLEVVLGAAVGHRPVVGRGVCHDRPHDPAPRPATMTRFIKHSVKADHESLDEATGLASGRSIRSSKQFSISSASESPQSRPLWPRCLGCTVALSDLCRSCREIFRRRPRSCPVVAALRLEEALAEPSDRSRRSAGRRAYGRDRQASLNAIAALGVSFRPWILPCGGRSGVCAWALVVQCGAGWSGRGAVWIWTSMTSGV